MLAEKKQNIDLNMFFKDQAPLIRDRIGIILLLGTIFVPLFGLLDFLLSPQFFERFMVYRLVASFSCLLLYLINRKWDLQQKSAYLGVIGFYIVGIVIIKMILDTGGFGTVYYAGLNLVFLGFCTVLPLGHKRIILHSLSLYSVYLILLIIFGQNGSFNLFLSNNLFVIATISIAVLVSLVNHNLRIKEYASRIALGKAQEKLKKYSKSLENSVEETEEKYRLVVDHANDAIFIYQDQVIKFPNPKTLDLFGFTAKELNSISFSELIHAEDKSWVIENLEQINKGIRKYSIDPFRITNKNGDILWVDIGSVSVKWQGRDAILYFIRDVTERKNMEVELVQAQKMEAIGTLTGGIAHDFNNLLQVISGYLELILLKSSEDDPNFYYLDQIEKSVNRASKLTRQLLLYGREVESKLQSMDLNRVIESVCSLLERVIPKMISIKTRLIPDLKRVNADPIQLEQIIMNLAVNARDAMPDGGEILIETKNILVDEQFARQNKDITPGEFILVVISDTGQGMDEIIMERIFDPFFTTKEKGKGTGLGLAVVYSIIKNHRGTIQCHSKEGLGTTFKIYLPIAKRDLQDIKENDRSSDIIKGNNEAILFVDDDQNLLEVSQNMLEMYNYQMISADSGEKAIEEFEKNRDIIDLVILDLNMPGMGGMKCFSKLRRLDPEVKILVTTGYLEDDQRHKILQSNTCGYLEKPYKFRDIFSKIRDVLSNC